jgi:lactoylglutathione lyase
VAARALGLNHIVLEVDDLDAALTFYGQLFEVELRGRVPGMAFIDMGDQFLVLAEGREQPPDGKRHFGLVVEEVLPGRGLDFRDPWGNHVQVVEYGDVQFQKSPAVLEGMGLSHLKKSEAALRELREKGLAGD